MTGVALWLVATGRSCMDAYKLSRERLASSLYSVAPVILKASAWVSASQG